MKFFVCEHCGKIITTVKETGVPVMCCGEKMKELIPGTTDASSEKHTPIYDVKDNIVSVIVGSMAHPMEQDHYIEWILLETKLGGQFRKLNSSDSPKASFTLCDGDAVKNVYAYCNKHGFWKS